MKFFRYGRAGHEKPGAFDRAGIRRDISSLVDDLGGKNLHPTVLAQLAEANIENCPVVSDAERLGACVASVGNFIGVGMNYADHVLEIAAETPVEPVLFNKAPSCIVGPNDDLILPRGSQKMDWEAELAVVIGAPAFQLEEADVDAVIAGYCVCNDVSERGFQFDRGGQFMKGKGCPTFGPLGPWLVTPDEIENPQDLRLWLTVNGERRQDGSTCEMIFPVRFLVSYVSQFMVLQPGDIITTGTPAGVALGMKEPRYLEAGDVVELGVDGLGTQRSRVISA